jgi:hypothetical protein
VPSLLLFFPLSSSFIFSVFTLPSFWVPLIPHQVTVLCAGHQSEENVQYTFTQPNEDNLREDVKIEEGKTEKRKNVHVMRKRRGKERKGRTRWERREKT